MPNDDVLTQVVNDIDSSLSVLLTKYPELTPLTFTSIILARILLINDGYGSGADFRLLLSEVIPMTPPPSAEHMH